MVALYIVAGIFFVFAAVFYFLTAPSMRRSADCFAGVRFAHRGLYGEGVNENSLRAFELAVENGYGIELDIRLTADGEVVVFHDDTLKRMCNVSQNVSALNYAELPLLPDGTKIPLFTEVLALTKSVPLLVELKGENSDTAICKAGDAILSSYEGSYCVESFNPIYMSWYKKNRPGVARGQLVTRIPYVGADDRKGRLLGWALSRLLLNFLSRPHFVACSVPHADTGAVNFVRTVFHTPLFAWTPRGEAQTEQSAERFDAVIFEQDGAALQPVKDISAS